jgi:acyl-CoA synthetase (AMP-forming)/AMP-acid ligase II
VGLFFRNSPHYVAAYYGTLAAGCVAVPLNPYDRGESLERQLVHAGASLLIGDRSHPEWSRIETLVGAHGIATLGIEVDDAAQSASNYVHAMGNVTAQIPSNLCADSLAAIVYTSGTTGSPKGVMLSHRNLAANTAAIVDYLALTPEDRGVAVLPMQFAYGNSVLHTHLAAGAELLLEDSFAYPHAVLQRMADEGVTGFSGVSSTYSLMMSRCELGKYNLGRLRYLTQAGGPMPIADIRRLQSQFPGVRLFVMYGQTEAAARLSFLPPDRLGDKAGSVGIAIPGVDLDVLRPDGTPAAPRETGEIVARGPNVMLGYLKDDAATCAALRDGWLHTGDAGHRDEDGFLYVEGRTTEMIKVGAFRISPYEIEEVIAAMDGVVEVAVAAVTDDLLGQAVKAVIVPATGKQLDPLTIKAHCRLHLATYKVPKHVEFAKALPQTPTGKIQRRLLA